MKSKKKYYIITIGCQMNKSDSERLAGYLESCGLKSAKVRKQADLVVLNTCGVRQSAEDRVYGLVKHVKEENPAVKLAITGCLTERKDVRARLKDRVDIWLPITEIPKFQPASRTGRFLISKQIKNSKFKIQNFRNCDYLRLKPIYGSKISAFIPIGNGCNNFCSYCVVPYARGRETWRPAVDILAEVEELVKRRYKEIVLIGQNVNSYKSQITNPKSQINSKFQIRNSKIDFSGLLRLVNAIPGDFWIRFATSHPKDMSDELIRTIAECEKICEHVHLPVQAGDDAVLKAMNRKYTARRYMGLVKEIKRKFQITNSKYQKNPKPKTQNPKFIKLPVSITTDVIVGFPGETKKQFSNTLKLFREMKFDQAFIARYSPRPGTTAVKLADDVPPEEKKRREKELEKIVSRTALINNKKYLGETVMVLVEGKNRKGEWFGRTRTNKNTAMTRSGNDIKEGDFVFVEITEANNFGLKGAFYNK
ncbi:MAG: tRNA (N6-isopentenyl adenosine(37)-C2)-methylthiotransferase MiaB [Planctomycetes bacterium]|jgi:tRNA-2-methylthio-N6-dimethylallyladenosine synthase|nr:tRNA (N6-isopentenyl adenosine(37)-C2)-methylthiotransferase MiaB [Planctomycetota bacterium]